MASTYPQEKVPLTAGLTVDTESLLTARSAAPARCCRRSAVRHAAGCALVSTLVLGGLLFTLGVSPLASMRRCHQNTEAAVLSPVEAVAETAPGVHGVQVEVGDQIAEIAVQAVQTTETIETAETAETAAPAFQRLMEAVSSESLHKLLHTYMPDTYKHGVFDSEKAALEAIHHTNPPLATSLAHLARRDGNSTISSTTPSSAPVSTPPTSSTPLPTTSTDTTSSSSETTPSTTSSSTSESATTPTTSTSASSSRRTTNTFTSTVNGTPVVVTATSIVGVAASATDAASSTPAGSLQTGAAAPGVGSPARAAGVAGVLAAGAMLLI